jgi:predicted glycoside hydrolase/deacetylase ChbG (UPF0249 family)
MAAGPVAVDAVKLAKRLPKLRVGLHLALLEEKPVLPPERISGLVDRSGRMRRTSFGWRSSLPDRRD